VKLAQLTGAIGRRIEPPACHDPRCGECARCDKRAPLSGALFRDVREAARPEGARVALATFRREIEELRARGFARERVEQLDKLEVAP
jgi:hypothetical protein